MPLYTQVAVVRDTCTDANCMTGGVGKSCLTAQFVQNVWIESYDPTIEDSYRKQIEVDGRHVILEILDTAGTEQFSKLQSSCMWHSNERLTRPSGHEVRTQIHTRRPRSRSSYPSYKAHTDHEHRELYMKSGQGFLLVFSITSQSSLRELTELREQLVRIKDDEKVPLVLVGNKSDLEESRTVSRSRAFGVSQSFGSKPYYETSARRRTNVDEVFKDLCRQIIRRETEMAREADREDQYVPQYVKDYEERRRRRKRRHHHKHQGSRCAIM
ncbi:MAG: hypothetical protein Q9159_007028 [Coniocarpon cinnabarinum]